MKAGDVLISRRPDGHWSVVKVLIIDVWPDGSQVFHCMFYKETAERPTEQTVESLQVLAMHSPVAEETYRQGWEVLCSYPVPDHELEGFHEYLKLTDFPRYAAVTGQDVGDLVSLANEHYGRARALGDAGERQKAIEHYSKAIEIFPLFYEAIDNRAFTYMELGDYATALRGFEESLRVNPNGNTAYFSRGECLVKLGQVDQAAAVFSEGAERFPEHRGLYLRFLAVSNAKAQALAGSRNQEAPVDRISPNVEEGSKARSWWRFWRR